MGRSTPAARNANVICGVFVFPSCGSPWNSPTSPLAVELTRLTDGWMAGDGFFGGRGARRDRRRGATGGKDGWGLKRWRRWCMVGSWRDDWMIGWLMVDDWWLMNHMTGIIRIIPILDVWTRISEGSRCWSTLDESDPTIYQSQLTAPQTFCHQKSLRQNFFPRIEVEGEVGIKSSIHQQKGHWWLSSKGFLSDWPSHTSWQNRNRGEIGSRDLYGAGGWQGVAMCAWFLKFVLGTQKDGCKKVGVWSITLPETNSSPLKMDGWNTIGFFWAPARPYFQGFCCSFCRGGYHP